MRPCKTFDQGLSLLAQQNAEMNTHDPDAVQAALQVSPLLIFKYLKVYMQLCNDAIMSKICSEKSHLQLGVILSGFRFWC